MASNTFLIFCIPLTLSCITYFWNPIGFPPIYIHYFERLNCGSTQDVTKYAMLLSSSCYYLLQTDGKI